MTDRILKVIARRANDLRDVVAHLTDADLARSDGEGWTIAAGLVHVALWDRRAQVLVEKWKGGVTPAESPADINVINDAAHYLIRLIPLRAAAEEALNAAEAVDRTLEDISDDLLQAILVARSPWVDRAATVSITYTRSSSPVGRSKKLSSPKAASNPFSAYTPNAKISAPGNRLTHASPRGVNADRKSSNTAHRMSHQVADPRNTPTTRTAAPLVAPGVCGGSRGRRRSRRMTVS